MTIIPHAVPSNEYSFELKLVHPTGKYTDTVDTYEQFDYTLVVNDVGVLNVTLPGSFPKYKLVPDARFEVWLTVGDGEPHLEGDTQFLIQTITTDVNGDGDKVYRVTAYTLNHIFKRRVIPYTSENVGFGYQIDQADDMMKVIVRQNFGTLATADRNISTYLSVDSNTSSAASIEMDVSSKYVLDVLKDIANASLESGIPLFFDIVVGAPPAGLTFRVFLYARGADRRASTNNPVILNQANGSIGAYTITEDYDQEINYVYALGPGEGDLQMTTEVSNQQRMTATPFALKEGIYNNQQTDSIDSLDAEGRAHLVSHRPKRLFQGTIANAPGVLYGRHWFHGDRVTAEADDEKFDTFVSAVHVSVSETDINIEAALRNDA